MTLTAQQLALQAANASVQKLTTASNSATIKVAKAKLSAAVVPFVADSPVPPPDQPTVSPDKATAIVGAGQIVNKAGHVFTVGADAKVYVDGKVLAGTNGVDRIQYVAATDEVRQHNVINPSQPWWSTPITDSGYQPVADPNGSSPTPPPPPAPSGGGLAAKPQGDIPGNWVLDPTRSWDFSEMADGALIPLLLWLARYARAGFDYDYGASTANSQIDSRQAYIKGGALRLGIGLADAAANANAALGGYSWKYVAGCLNGKGGLFIANNEIMEFDVQLASWARGRWDAHPWWVGLDANGNEVWPPEEDTAETDNSWGSANITNTTFNWHDGYNSGQLSQTGPTAYSPAIDVTRPHTYTVPRIGDRWGTWCDGVQRGADSPKMSTQQAALRIYPIIGASVREGFNDAPTGDAIIIPQIRTYKLAA